MKAKITFDTKGRRAGKPRTRPVTENETTDDVVGDLSGYQEDNAIKASTQPFQENEVRILTFEQFVMEADNFATQFGDEPETHEDDTDPDMHGEGSDAGTQDGDDDGDGPEPDDDWNKPETPDSDHESDFPGSIDDVNSGSGVEDVYRASNDLATVNKQIEDLLKMYKAGSMSVSDYKDKASPLLAKRKQLQAVQDAAFSVGSSMGDESGSANPDSDFKFAA